MSRVLAEDYSWLLVFFAGVFGSGLVGVAYADNATVDVQERAKKERERIEAFFRSRGIRYGSYPSFSVAVKGQKGVCGCDRFKSGSIKDVIKTIVKKDGYRGLMRGWIPRMLFHAPAAAICWSTYEAGKSFFQDFNQQKDVGTVT